MISFTRLSIHMKIFVFNEGYYALSSNFQAQRGAQLRNEIEICLKFYRTQTSTTLKNDYGYVQKIPIYV